MTSQLRMSLGRDARSMGILCWAEWMLEDMHVPPAWKFVLKAARIPKRVSQRQSLRGVEF